MDLYPIPRINYIIDPLRDARFLSGPVFREWQILLEEANRGFTAITGSGKCLFQWRVMPFHCSRGLDLMWTTCLTYQDDIIVIGRTLVEQKRNFR